MEYKNIQVTEKSGTKEKGYTYKGTLDVFLEEDYYEGWLKTKKTKKVKYPVSFEYEAMGEDNTVESIFWRGDVNYYGYRALVGKTDFMCGESPTDLIKTKCLQSKLKSVDECCASPDYEACNTYPVHDIILCHLLDTPGVEVKDYCFKRSGLTYNHLCVPFSFGYIKFSYEDQEYHYSVKLSDKISEKVCLNCSSIDSSEEKQVINSFKDWFKEEKRKNKRKQKAKEICERRDL